MNSEPGEQTLARCKLRPMSTVEASELRVSIGYDHGRPYAELRFYNKLDGCWHPGKGLRVREQELDAVAEAFVEAARRAKIDPSRPT